MEVVTTIDRIRKSEAVFGALEGEVPMRSSQRAQTFVRDMQRVTPYMYEGLYGSFLHYFMESDKSHWTGNLSAHLSQINQEWAEVGEEMAEVLWEEFEKRITC
jgi:hypothetical protein